MREKINPGLMAALMTPIFLGMNPIFGKLAYRNGADPFTVAALRTGLAVFILGIIYLLFWRKYLYIYPLGLINCVALGFVNGVGSLFYYNGLNLLDASVAQLINGMYLVFVIILTRIGGDKIGWRTVIRVGVALLGILLITGGIEGEATWLGVGLMLANALLFAGTVVMSQRALHEMPAQTVTFYALLTMAIVVAMARVAYDLPIFIKDNVNANLNAMWAIIGLAITTALSRLLMFLGVKGLGSVRTTLLAIFEMATSITLAFLLFGESFTVIQWWGVGVLLFSMLIPVDLVPKNISPTAYWPDITRVQLWQVAFNHAFTDNITKLSSQEMKTVQTLMKRDKYTTQDMIVVGELFESTKPKPPQDLAEYLQQEGLLESFNKNQNSQSPSESDDEIPDEENEASEV